MFFFFQYYSFTMKLGQKVQWNWLNRNQVCLICLMLRQIAKYSKSLETIQATTTTNSEWINSQESGLINESD
uniref:Uncharacterized protein n=1 Tax=Nelumbo nucifera TaxID=4432 RepID=A0A822Z2A4_NELNU|nr:TPA_asm: hypothetical protein HUJ06_014877 [Nelumbo nucifera]